MAYKTLTDPAGLFDKPSADEHLDGYRLAWAYYSRKAFAVENDWSWLRTKEDLYQHTKLVFNVVPNIIDFYVDNIWSAPSDADHPSLVTPVAYAANPKIIDTIAQIDQWTNFWRAQAEIKAYTAVAGSCLVEIIDNEDRQKIEQNTVWAGFIKHIEMNRAGDVEAYTVEIPVYDPVLKETFRFRKEITKDDFRFFYNDKPFDYLGKPSVVTNPYGFCPAVQFRHTGAGAFGDAAFNDYAKVNHANSLASHLHDNIHKEIESGKWLGLEDPASIMTISGATKNADGTIREADTRLERVLIASKGVVSVNDLSGKLKLAEAQPYLKELLVSFGADYPELEYRQIIKENATLSGIALERLLTPAQNRLDRAAPNYDGQLIKLRQMQTAIGGWRLSNGWAGKTNQQKVFAPFNLDSYEGGDLDFNLKRSLLIEQSEDERVAIDGAKLDNANKATGLLPLRERIAFLGYDEKKIKEIISQLAKEDPITAQAYGMTDAAANVAVTTK